MDATAAFGRLIRNRYGEQLGLWQCAHGYSKRELDCWAEVHRARTFRTIYAATPAPPAAPRFSKLSSQRWTRRWRRLPSDPAVRASEWANASDYAFDWPWLARAAESDYASHRLPGRENSVDGGSAGMPQAIILFRCGLRGHDVVCRNGLGDALRLHPLVR